MWKQEDNSTTILSNYNNAGTHFDFSPDGNILVSGSSSKLVKYWLLNQVALPKITVSNSWRGDKLCWMPGRASFSGSGVEEDRRVNQRGLNFPIAENPIFSLAIAKKSHPSCYKSTSSKACPTWHSADLLQKSFVI